MSASLRTRWLGAALLALVACSSAAPTPVRAAPHAAHPQHEAQAVKASEEPLHGIRVARRCYCMNRRGGEAEFRLKLAASEPARAGLAIRVFPGANSQSLLVNSRVSLGSKYEIVRFKIPALSGVEEFRLELRAQSERGTIGEVVADRCADACNF